MGDEKEIKRYEPYGFLLVLGMFSMLAVMLFALYKFRRNLLAGVITAPELGPPAYTATTVLVLAFISLVLGSGFFRRQQFPAFRICLAGSFAGTLLFVLWQMAGLSLGKVTGDPFQQGRYYLAFLSGVHLLFVLSGLVANAVLLARAYRTKAYVESFIFSVNPPNILNMKLLVRYMGFVTVLWVVVIIFLRGHAA